MNNSRFNSVLDLYKKILNDNNIHAGYLNILINLDDKDASLTDIMHMSKEERDNCPMVNVTIQFCMYGWGTIGWDLDSEPILDDDGEETGKYEEQDIFEYQAAQDAANLIFGRALETNLGWLAESLLKSNIDWKIK